MTSRQVSLSVNDKSIELDYFVQSFIDHTTSGMLESLEGTGKVKTLDIIIEQDKVKVTLNNAPVPLNPFVTKIIRNTIAGMVSSLKGVSQIDKVNISIKK